MIPVQEHISNDLVIGQVAEDDKIARLAVRGKLDALEEAMKEEFGGERGQMDEINENGLQEYLVEKAYIRELFIPKGVVIVSHLWNRDRFWIIAQGDVTFTSEIGTQRIKAPYRAIAPFGSKIALYTHEDTLWFAITGVEADTVEDCEAEVKALNYAELPYPWDKGDES